MIGHRISRDLPPGWGFKPRRTRRHGERSHWTDQIVAELVANAPVLRLPKRTVIRDVRARFPVRKSAAYRAVAMALQVSA